MVSEAKLKAQYKYDKANTQQVMLKLNKSSDADILMKLKSIDNRQGYIKELVRKDMQQKDGVLAKDSIAFLVIPTAKRYGLNSIHLFGSYARNEATPDSDIDLLIDGGNYEGLIEYADMVGSLENALGKSVDVVTTAAIKDNKSESGKRFKSNINKDKVLIYES